MARRPRKRVAQRAVTKPTRRLARQSPAVSAPRHQRLHNLPTQLTSFIGREREIAEIKRVLGTTRLLSLTGSGGCGKTRLALQVAADLLEQYPDGVWLVELASLSDPAFILKTAASALDVLEQPDHPLVEALTHFLRRKRVLLLLDNCEHLRSGCQDLIETILRACPAVRILATSREALAVEGALTYRVPSLGLPDIQNSPHLARLMEYDAIRLLVERATLVQPDFIPTEQNARTIVQICQRLDGMPLAIEFAAARVRTLSVEQIAARLDDRFQLLTAGMRRTVPRQQTLRATMDWSYDLLSDLEQAMLRRLSIFAGRWTLEAAEVVCVGAGVGPADVLDLLTSLVDKSLAIAETRGGEAHYALLETVRQYGLDRLQDSGETIETQQRHRDWYLALAERAESELRGPNQIAWLERLEENHDNLRAALEWSTRDKGSDAAGLRLAAALWDFWDIRGYFAEGRTWFDTMLSLYQDAPSVLRAQALTRAAHLAHRQSDYGRVRAMCEEALALSQTAGFKQGNAEALHYLAHAAEGAGDYRQAKELLKRSVALHREAGHTLTLARTMSCLANSVRIGGDYERAAALLEEALQLFRSVGDKVGRRTGLLNLGHVTLRQGQHKRARSLFHESLRLSEELDDRRAVMGCLGGLAAASTDAESEWAATLFGATAALMSAAGVWVEPVNRPDFDGQVAAVRKQLGEPAFQVAWAGGQAMTLEQAVEYAVASLESAQPKSQQSRIAKQLSYLSPREREVAALVADGLTNRAIASRLIIAERTIDTHVEHILNKLGFTSRTQIAAWAVEQGLHKLTPS